MKATSVTIKFLASIINAIVALVITSFFLFLHGADLEWKCLAIAVFFVYELVWLFTEDKRDLGMMVVGSHWSTPPSHAKYIIYNILYTLSFATLFFYVIFPLDLLLFNLIIIQLPFIIFSGTTLHGYLSGMRTIK